MKCEWNIGDNAAAAYGFAVAGTLADIASKNVAALMDLFPLQHGWEANAYTGDGWLAVRVTDRRGQAIPTCGRLPEADVEYLRNRIEPFRPLSHAALMSLLDESWFGPKTFTYVGPYLAGKCSWPDVTTHLGGWLNGYVLPYVTELNKQRVLLAIPTAPQFNINAIREHLWVLECEESCSQGTAFLLEGVGMVTCDHVLGPSTQAFKASDFEKKFPVQVLARNKDIDLAIVSISSETSSGLKRSSADALREMDHIAVTGFPNYNIGDSGIISPGLVVGFRMRSGIRHILTNAPIVTGCSGGPVLDQSNAVIGVAVTGASSLKSAPDTEKHGVVPIDAIRYLIGDR